MIKLYGSQFSLYTGKARSYLKKKGIQFEEITSTMSVYKNFIVPRAGVRFVPVIQTDDDVVIQDTTVIIDAMEQVYPERSVYPSTPRLKLASLLLEVYGDEWLVIPAMHYRWNFPKKNDKFIYAAFGSLVLPGAPKFIQRIFGKKIGAKFKSFVPRLGINSDNIPAIEASYEQLLSDLNCHFKEHDFLFGGRPSIGDFGLIGPLYAHLYRDPAPGELIKRIAPEVCAWVERMISDEVPKGQFLANDEVPQTLMPILQRMASEQLPVLLDTDQRLTEWRKANPGCREVARFIGTHKFVVENVESERAVLPFALWMYKRPVDFYSGLEDKSSADQMLETAGFGSALQSGLQNHLAKVNNIIVFEDWKPDQDS
ncbi:MAG: glutathione S-transferase family protein [Gammaproteobacteria bacterium]|nr:glutathione S-transferase family protein [Gammaproteobacteria bacterium]